MKPRSAFVIVDVQNDFISGSLAIKNCPAGQEGEEVVPPINRLLDTVPFTMHCYSLDWHPADHISFIDNVKMRKLSPESKVGGRPSLFNLIETVEISNPERCALYDTVTFEGPNGLMEQVLWPAHCVQDSWGAELHQDLKVLTSTILSTSLSSCLRSIPRPRSSTRGSILMSTPTAHFLISN